MATKSPVDPITRELSSFFKQAVDTLDEVKESVLKGGSATKATIDTQLLKRQRKDALARLGEVLLDEVARGAVLPASCDALAKEVKDLDAQIAKAKAEVDAVLHSKPEEKKAAAPAASSPEDDVDEE